MGDVNRASLCSERKACDFLNLGVNSAQNSCADGAEKSGCCLSVQVTKQGRQETKALLLLLDIQASLCRLNENAVAFADNGGIETTIRIIHQFDYDVGLLTLGESLCR